MNTTNKTQVWQHIASIANCAAVIRKEREYIIDLLCGIHFEKHDVRKRASDRLRNPVDDILEMMNDALKIMNKGGAE